MPTSSSSSSLSSLFLSFSKVFLRQFFTQVVINVVRFPFFDYSLDISSLHTLCYTSLFPMLTGQMVLSFLLHCHISKFCKCFWSTSRSDQITTPHNAMYRLQHFSNFFLKNNFGLLVDGASVFLYATYVMAVLEWISHVRQKYCTYKDLLV